MKSDGLPKHVLFAFVLALALYFGSFRIIEHFRQVKGPWQVAFRSDAEGLLSVTVSQPQLKISDVSFEFPDVQSDQSNTTRTVIFDSPITNIPFGKVIFLDTTFLPGTVTLDFFGHEIELLPRVLAVNRKEVSWKSGARFQLLQTEKPPPRDTARKWNGARPKP